jgi:hypothetical protein
MSMLEAQRGVFMPVKSRMKNRTNDDSPV